MSTLVALPSADVAQMLTDIATLSVDDFIVKWNVRDFCLKDHSHYDCQLLNAAVARDERELVRFVYQLLVYEAKFYSFERLQMASVKSAAMRDRLVKYTYKFGDDYYAYLEKFRGQLKALTF